MAALQELNAAEEAEENLHEVISPNVKNRTKSCPSMKSAIEVCVEQDSPFTMSILILSQWVKAVSAMFILCS